MKNILMAFIPVFVAMDAVGVLPIFFSLTEGFGIAEKRKVIYESIVTAVCLAAGFIFLGKAIFSFLNITIGDFMVAGGALLFCIAIIDLLNPGKERRIPASELGVVPLGTPLIVGPAVLTTSLLVTDEYGLTATLISVLGNVVITGVFFVFSARLIKFLGISGARALSKITSLLLAAIAIMMVRKGVTFMFSV